MQQTIAGCDLYAGNITEQSTETDGYKKQWLEFLDDAEVQQQQTHRDHRDLPTAYLVDT
jgi:hypothetical protein